MTDDEELAEKIALLLLDSSDINGVAEEARQMAYRAKRARDDPSWWSIVGRPAWNERMARLRAKMEKRHG